MQQFVFQSPVQLTGTLALRTKQQREIGGGQTELPSPTYCHLPPTNQNWSRWTVAPSTGSRPEYKLYGVNPPGEEFVNGRTLFDPTDLFLCLYILVYKYKLKFTMDGGLSLLNVISYGL